MGGLGGNTSNISTKRKGPVMKCILNDSMKEPKISIIPDNY